MGNFRQYSILIFKSALWRLICLSNANFLLTSLLDSSSYKVHKFNRILSFRLFCVFAAIACSNIDIASFNLPEYNKQTPILFSTSVLVGSVSRAFWKNTKASLKSFCATAISPLSIKSRASVSVVLVSRIRRASENFRSAPKTSPHCK